MVVRRLLHGTLDEFIAHGELEAVGAVHRGAERRRATSARLAEGDFTQEVVGTRFRVNVSPDLQFNSYLQYDNESDDFGTNTRLRWTFSPLGELFVVYNHNVARELFTGEPPGSAIARRRWELASNELLVKLQYAFRY